MEESMEAPLKNYVTVSKQGSLIPNRKASLSPHPKVSIIIPMYNEAKNVIPVIRSAQNQQMEEIEIICIDDNSNDDTLHILHQLQLSDPRIKVISNKINRGVLYNRIYGAIQSKGEYVTYLDADDCLCNINILDFAYQHATQNYGEKIDIVHYQTCGSSIDEEGNLGKFVIFQSFDGRHFNQVIRQPDIGDNYMQHGKNVTGSGLVFDKIYRRELMIKVANYLGPHIWNQNLVFVDDFLLAFGCMKVTRNIVNIADVGYWHYFDKKTSTTSNVWKYDGYQLVDPDKTNKKIGDYMVILERMYELTEDERQMLEFREDIIKELTKDDYMPTIARSVHYNRLLNLCEKLYNWKYIDNEAKNRARDYIRIVLSYRIDPEKKFAHLFY